MSTQSQSNPECAISSAEKLEGTVSHPPSAACPASHMRFTRFSRISPPIIRRHTRGPSFRSSGLFPRLRLTRRSVYAECFPAVSIDVVAWTLRSLGRHLLELLSRFAQHIAHALHLRGIASRRRPERSSRDPHERPHHLGPAGTERVPPVIPGRRPAPDALHPGRFLLECVPPFVGNVIDALTVLTRLHTHQSLVLQLLEIRVDSPGARLVHAAGAHFHLFHQLIAVHRPLRQQREQRQTDLARLEEAPPPAPRLAPVPLGLEAEPGTPA